MSFLEVFLIILYCALFSMIISRTRIFDSAYITKPFLVKIFLLKVLVGYLYSYIHFENGWDDTFAFFLSGKTIANLLPENPDLYFQFVFGHVPKPFSPEVVEQLGTDVLLKYGIARSDFMVRICALLIPFCYGFFSVLCIFFEFFSLLGLFYIYDFLAKRFSFNLKVLKLFLFFAPSILFWFSGVHKDALTIFGFGVILFSVSQLQKKHWMYVLYLLFGLSFTFYIRDYALLLFIPALLSYLLALQLKRHFQLAYLFIYSVGILFFFGGKYLSPKLDFPAKFVQYQKAFVRLEGGSNFEVVELEPTVESFATSVPIAFFHTIFKPNFSQIHNVWAALAATENIFYVITSIIFLLFSNSKRLSKEQRITLLFFGVFGLSYFLVLGLVVDNLGAIVRYKTTPLVFLGSAIILLCDFNRLVKFFGLRNSKLFRYLSRR